MKRIILDNYEAVSSAAADIFVQQLSNKPDSVLGLATGSTPLGLYAELVRRYQAGIVDFSKARSFNLDEYYPISKNHPQSYNHYMRKNLFDKVNFAQYHLPNGETGDPQFECSMYDIAIKSAGGIDLQLLGLGVNGHIGFNEPTVSYPMSTNLVGLTDSTLSANSRFFSDGVKQPTQALTMGFGAIFSAKRILLLICGASKAAITEKLFSGFIHTDVPACLLLLHPDVIVIMDHEAESK